MCDKIHTEDSTKPKSHNRPTRNSVASANSFHAVLPTKKTHEIVQRSSIKSYIHPILISSTSICSKLRRIHEMLPRLPTNLDQHLFRIHEQLSRSTNMEHISILSGVFSTRSSFQPTLIDSSPPFSKPPASHVEHNCERKDPQPFHLFATDQNPSSLSCSNKEISWWKMPPKLEKKTDRR